MGQKDYEAFKATLREWKKSNPDTNAANEEAVGLFLDNKISFTDIFD